MIIHISSHKCRWYCKSCCSSTGRQQSLTIGHLTISLAVLMETTQTSPSLPGWVAITRLIGQRVGGTRSSMIKTIVPTFRLLCLFRHLGSVCRCWRYSRRHQCQKSSRSWLSSFHTEHGLPSDGCCPGSGTESKRRPINRWPGVRGGKSVGSLGKGAKGREFKHATI